MADELLIRIYDVGLGDCIYVQIPGAAEGREDAFHMLIDCGSWSGEAVLTAAITQLKTELPELPGNRRRLDLIVVTHEHKDHIAGFDPQLFADIDVGAVWMNCAMNPKHPQAGKSRKLRSIAEAAVQALIETGAGHGARADDLLSVFQINNRDALKALRETLLRGRAPTYVEAGQTNETHDIALHEATIHILGPEADFDRFYLGKATEMAIKNLSNAHDKVDEIPISVPTPAEIPTPFNISPAAFRTLRARMQSNALTFAALDGTLKNNSSVVLLVEWRGRRLLFVGDAEWHGAFKEGKMNGAWNVMWNQRQALLGKPVDFLKIGHHGSENSTPWDMGKGSAGEPIDILNAILPLPVSGERPTAMAVVSTERRKYPTIPRALLMTEIAKRIANTRIYHQDLPNFAPDNETNFDRFEKPYFDQPQPWRTDLERIRSKTGFVDLIMKPKFEN